MNRVRATMPIALLLVVNLAAHAAPAPDGGAKAPRQHLSEILERPLYRAWQSRQEAEGFRTPTLPTIDEQSWIRRPFRRIGEFFEWLIRGPSGRTSAWKPSLGAGLPAVLKAIAWVVLIIAMLFVVVLLIRMLFKPQATIATARVLSREQLRQAMESGDALALGSSEWIDEANRLAAEQDFRAVYRALYLALLSGLHTAGKIEHSRNRTNWTYVRRYRGPSDERESFGELTSLFDLVWYGRKPAVGGNLDELRRKVSALTQSPARPARGGSAK